MNEKLSQLCEKVFLFAHLDSQSPFKKKIANRTVDLGFSVDKHAIIVQYV